MLSTSKGEEAVKVSIPRKLHMAILKIQVDNNINWDDACVKVAELTNTNSEEIGTSIKFTSKLVLKSHLPHQDSINPICV